MVSEMKQMDKDHGQVCKCHGEFESFSIKCLWDDGYPLTEISTKLLATTNATVHGSTAAPPRRQGTARQEQWFTLCWWRSLPIKLCILVTEIGSGFSDQSFYIYILYVVASLKLTVKERSLSQFFFNVEIFITSLKNTDLRLKAVTYWNKNFDLCAVLICWALLTEYASAMM